MGGAGHDLYDPRAHKVRAHQEVEPPVSKKAVESAQAAPHNTAAGTPADAGDAG